MAVDRAILEADLTLLRGLVRQMNAEGDADGVVAAITDLAALIADRSGANRGDVEARLYNLMRDEGLVPQVAEASTASGAG